MNATWLTILSRLGILLWLATDQLVLLIVCALLGLALGLGLRADNNG